MIKLLHFMLCNGSFKMDLFSMIIISRYKMGNQIQSLHLGSKINLEEVFLGRHETKTIITLVFISLMYSFDH